MAKPVIVLFDDERSFVDGFRENVTILRTVSEAEDFFSNYEGDIDELWLDFVLTPGDTTEGIRALNGRPINVRKAYFHSSAYAARSLVEAFLKRAGVTVPLEFPPTGEQIFVAKNK